MRESESPGAGSAGPKNGRAGSAGPKNGGAGPRNGDEPHSTPGRARRVAFYVVTVLFLFAHILLSPLPGLYLGWFLESAIASHRVHEISFGLIFAISTAGLLAHLRRPQNKVGQMYQVAIPIWLTVAAIFIVDRTLDPIIVAFFLFPLLMIFLHPNRAEVLRPKRNPSVPLLVAVLIAAVPLVTFAFTEFNEGLRAAGVAPEVIERVENEVPEDAPVAEFEREFKLQLRRATDSAEAYEAAQHYGHWSAMGAFALSIVAVATVAALRIRGAWLCAWSAGLAMIVYGVASWINPEVASAANRFFAVMAALWGLALIALFLKERRDKPVREARRPRGTLTPIEEP